MSFIPMRVSVGTVSSVTGISGSGTSGQVAYFSGATQLSSQSTFTFNGTDIAMTCPTANPLIIRALTGNSNGLRIYCNTASDNASIVNFYSADLEIGTNNTVYQTITSAGVTTFGGNTIARKDQNATTMLQVRNDNAGASAAARIAITSDQGDFSIFANSAAGGDTVALTADSTFGGGMDVGILGNNAIRVNTNGNTRIAVSGDGKVSLNGASTASLAAGGLALTDRIAAGAGSIGTPSLHSVDDPNSGFNINGSDLVHVVTGGVAAITVSAAQLVTIGATGGTEIHRINGDTGTAGAVATYLKLNVNGTEYRVPLHATA